MEAPDKSLAQFSRQKCHQTREACSRPGSGQIHPAEGMRRSRPEYLRVSGRRQCLRLPGLPEQAQRPWVRLRDREYATMRSPVDSIHFSPNRAVGVGPRCLGLLDYRWLFLSYAPGWWLVDNRPKHAEFLDGVHEFVEIYWLHHIGVNAQFVAGHHVLFFMG